MVAVGGNQVASVIETRFTEALRRISRVATREPIVPHLLEVRASSQLSKFARNHLFPVQFRSSQSQSQRPPRDEEEREIFPFFEGNRMLLNGLRTNNIETLGQKISGKDFEKSIATPGLLFEVAVARLHLVEKTRAEDRFLVSLGAMTRSKTQRALKPLVTYVHARCGRLLDACDQARGIRRVGFSFSFSWIGQTIVQDSTTFFDTVEAWLIKRGGFFLRIELFFGDDLFCVGDLEILLIRLRFDVENCCRFSKKFIQMHSRFRDDYSNCD